MSNLLTDIMNGNHIMVDLETLGTSSNSVILSIGAVRIDNPSDNYFYSIIDIQSCLKSGLSIDAAAVCWWMQQDHAARSIFKVISRGEGKHLYSELKRFRNWLGDDPVIWGNGSDFDNSLLADAYKKAQLQTPWNFYNNRCYRTLKNLHPEIEIDRTGTLHNARDDAESQAKHLLKIAHANQRKSQTCNSQPKP